MNDTTNHNEGRAFRWTVGMLVLLTAIGGFAALFQVRVPPENKDSMMLALGFVFGWAASVVASEFGSTTTGRKVAESAVRNIERQSIAAEQTPAGTAEDPIAVAGAAPNAKPVEIKDAKP